VAKPTAQWQARRSGAFRRARNVGMTYLNNQSIAVETVVTTTFQLGQ
jgi:hypothetical protein